MNNNKGIWYSKEDYRRYIVIRNEDEPAPEGFTQARPLPNEPYQLYDEATGEWVIDPDSERLKEIVMCKAELARIDRETGVGRAVRSITLEAGLKAGIPVKEGNDMDRLQKKESRAAELRGRLKELEA